MSNLNMKSSPAIGDAWNQVEDIGVQIGIIRNALNVGNWAIAYQDGAIGGIKEEMADYFHILDHYLGEMEQKCMGICNTLLEEKKSREEVA